MQCETNGGFSAPLPSTNGSSSPSCLAAADISKLPPLGAGYPSGFAMDPLSLAISITVYCFRHLPFVTHSFVVFSEFTES